MMENMKDEHDETITCIQRTVPAENKVAVQVVAHYLVRSKVYLQHIYICRWYDL